MWADTLHLSIGGWQLGVRVDTARTAERLRTLFAPYLSTHAHGTRLPSNFSIREPVGTLRRKGGRVYLGGTRIAESKSFNTLVGALVIRLSSLDIAGPPLVAVDMRAFVRNDVAVIVDVQRPELISNAALDAAGIAELPSWRPAVDLSNGTVVEQLALPGLDWKGAGLRPPSFTPRRYPISAVVTAERDGRPDLAGAWARAGGDREGWLRLLGSLDANHRLLSFTTLDGAADATIAAFT